MTETSVVKIASGEVKDGWPVRVYRKTEQHGWQRMKPYNSQGRTVVIRASPRSGCIVLPRIQVRIRLLTSTKEGSKRNDAVVVRRRNLLLVSSRSHVRCLVLKFSDLQSCLDFSDRLIKLNPSALGIRRFSSYSKNLLADAGHVGARRSIEDEPDLCAAESQQVLSLLGRLLCDEDFAELCHNLESSIRASEDGMQMIATLIDR